LVEKKVSYFLKTKLLEILLSAEEKEQITAAYYPVLLENETLIFDQIPLPEILS